MNADYKYGGSDKGSDKSSLSQIFLLSVEEAKNSRYFANDADRVPAQSAGNSQSWCFARRVSALVARRTLTPRFGLVLT